MRPFLDIDHDCEAAISSRDTYTRESRESQSRGWAAAAHAFVIGFLAKKRVTLWYTVYTRHVTLCVYQTKVSERNHCSHTHILTHIQLSFDK